MPFTQLNHLAKQYNKLHKDKLSNCVHTVRVYMRNRSG